MKKLTPFSGIPTAFVVFSLALMGAAQAKDALDLVPGKSQKSSAPAAAQTYVYHTNGALWMGWDSYGNTGDQTCSAITPGWIYPGSFSGAGHGYLNYNCRAGYWIVAKVGTEYKEGTTGQYVLTVGTEPGATSQDWANESVYNKEPWVSNAEWTIPSIPVTVNATRRSWSFPGETNNYFTIGEFDYNDFVIEEITITNTGTANLADVVLGSKADHDCTWNVPFPDWNYPFWTDDITDYDEETMTTMELDGDDQATAANDFGIDDPIREYRGVRVGQTPLNLNGENHDELESSDVNHMWWTGDQDPQTAAARYTMATKVHSTGGDNKGTNPQPADMRYLQSYGPFAIPAGGSVTLVFAVLAGAGMDNAQQAAVNAKQAYDWEYNLPKPPSAPQVAGDDVVTTADGKVSVTWAYSSSQINAVDPDKGTADFAGFRVYRASAAPKRTSESLGLEADALSGMTGDVTQGTSFAASASGPYFEIADLPKTSAEYNAANNGDGTFTYVDGNVALGLTYWYYVAAYDAAGSDAIHGSVPSLESYYTMCYPLQTAPDQVSDIPSAPPAFTVSLEEVEYEDIDGKASTAVFVAPNPWRATTMETYHGAGAPSGYFVRFYNVKAGDVVKVFDVAGNLVFESDAVAENGSFDWNLVSRTRNQVATGVYYWTAGDDDGKLAVIR